MRPAQLNIGIIGVGLLGGQHARHSSSHPDVMLKAVADPRRQVGATLGRETGATWYPDYAAMLAKEDLDLVVVATPDALHREPVVAAARAGVPFIITEKPLATSREDALRMRDAVTRAGAALHILFPNRFDPLDRAVGYVMEKGLIGMPVHGDVRLDDNISVPTRMWGRRSREWAGGSSTAHFLLSHVVDLLRFYFRPAEIVEVYAISQSRVLKYTPDLYDAYLTFDNGLTMRIKAEWIRRMDALVEFDLGFSGQRGSLVYRKHSAFMARRGLRLDVERVSAATLSKHQAALAKRDIRSRIIADPDARTPRVLEIDPDDNPWDWSSALGQYFATLRNGWKGPRIEGFGALPSLSDALRQVDVVAAIVSSASKRKAVKVPRS